MAEHPKESAHWYRRDATEAHETIGKNGQPRPTTLRDARKEGLLPSVTSIIRCAAAPGLENWKIDQAILSALTLPKLNDEPEAAYLSRIKLDAKEQARKAAERGTLIHSWVQKGFHGEFLNEVINQFYDSAKKTLDKECNPIEWISEKSFTRDGFGGKADLHCDGLLIDIKTTTKTLQNIKTWPKHEMQLSAYRHGLGQPDAKSGILYVHAENAEAKLLWIPEEDLKRGLKCFMALKDYFYAKTGL